MNEILEKRNGVYELLNNDDSTIGYYEFYLDSHPDIRRNIDKIAKLDTDTLWIKLQNGEKLIFDLNTDTFREPTFGETLNGMLKFKHLTRKALSNRIGVYPSEISEYISGEKTPSIYTLQEIARALSCSIDDFY